jgi:hypothetical protein
MMQEHRQRRQQAHMAGNLNDQESFWNLKRWDLL